jgi:hypothetical protein
MKIVVRGAWSDSDARRYKLLRADHIELNHAKGFDPDSSLAFLSDLEGLRRLTLLVPSTVDLSPVTRCRDLEQLLLDVPRVKEPVALGGLGQLRDLAVEKPAMVSDLDELTGLTNLLIGRYPETSLVRLGRLTNVTALRLYQAKELTSLQGVELLTRLTEFECGGARRLTDVSALAASQELRMLDVTNAVAVCDWSVLGELSHVHTVSLEDCKAINSVDFAMRLGKLEKLFVIGTTVADGRVAQLGRHPSLRKVSLAQSSLHDATAEQIQKQLGRSSVFGDVRDLFGLVRAVIRS